MGDLPAVGAAFAAGDVSGAHVEVAVRTHKELGARAREILMDCQTPDGDPDTHPDPIRTATATATRRASRR